MIRIFIAMSYFKLDTNICINIRSDRKIHADIFVIVIIFTQCSGCIGYNAF